MKYGSFGGTGIKVSKIALGTWYLPHESTPDTQGVYRVSKDKSISVVERAIDLGINFFDTANVYAGVYDRKRQTRDYTKVGDSESVLGEALKGHDRESLVVVTKVSGRIGPLPNDEGYNRKHLRKALENSLSRLKTDYVDFYLLHVPDETTSLETAVRSMNHLIDQGHILHYGISNFSAEQIEEMFRICIESGLEPPAAVQDEYNLIDRNFEKEELGIVEKHKMGAMIYSPLAQGVLAGRYSGTPEGPSRVQYDGSFSDKAQEMLANRTVKAVSELSRGKSMSMANISLSWLISKSKNIFPIVGASDTKQLDDNAKATDIVLGEENYKLLELV